MRSRAQTSVLTDFNSEENRRVQDVLDHARLLVVRFFNKERVVLDSFREQLSSRTGDERRVQENDKRQVTRFARGYAR